MKPIAKYSPWRRPWPWPSRPWPPSFSSPWWNTEFIKAEAARPCANAPAAN